MGKAGLAPASFKELAVERRKQPAFRFRGISQLIAFGGPNIKRLLRQIAGFRFRPSQAERKLIERTIVLLDQALKVRPCGALIGVTHQTAVCSRAPAKTCW